MAQITLNSSGVASNGTLALQSNGTTTAVTIDTSQNVGVGVTPSAFGSGFKALQMNGGSLMAYNGTNMYYLNNAYYDGTNYKYVTSSFATSYIQSSGIHTWSYAASGTAGNNITFTEAMRIDSSGNVGIGTTPNTWFSGYKVIEMGSGSLVYPNSSTNTQLWNNLYVNAAGNTIYKSTGIGGLYSIGAGGNAHVWYSAASGTAGATATLTQAMTLDSSGNLLVGTTSSNARVVVKGTSGDGFGGGVQWIKGTADNRWEFVVGGDTKFYLGYGAGTTPTAVGNFATNGTYTATSDVRKKKDISYEFEGLSLVQALKPAMGRMLDDESSFPLRPFFIAQDIQPVLPSLVSSLDPDSSALNPFLGVDYASIAPVLVKAIQEMKAIIDTQASTITSLTDRITALEAK